MTKYLKAFKIIINKISNELVYFKNRARINNGIFDVSILSIDDTIDFMSKKNNSIVRFGDGEFMLMNGRSIENYQQYDDQLRIRLKEAFDSNIPNLLVCVPEPIVGIQNYKRKSQVHWTNQITKDEEMYRSILQENKVYGNSFVSRPYMIYKNKKDCGRWFNAIKSIFTNQDLVIIEGYYSRSGVGNDLFMNAKSVKRILCPSQNAFCCYNKILTEAKKIDKWCLIIIAIGPTGKVLTADLTNLGYWVLDLGHIDSEYEWFLSNAHKKKRIQNKHTADTKDVDLIECTDQNYNNSIISVIKQ